MKAIAKKTSIQRSNTTRELIREKAKEQGALRSSEIRRKVEDAMKAITEEMAENEGIYPQNKGAVSAAEVARRAGVHPTTLFSPRQRELGNEVKAWVTSLKAEEVVGRGPVRRALAERISDWKNLYEGLAQSHRDSELQLQAAEAELERVRAELDNLTRAHTALRKLLSDGKVVPFLPKEP